MLECWDDEPDNRPTIYEVVERLSVMISQSDKPICQQQNENIDKIADQVANKNILMKIYHMENYLE